MPQIPLWPPLSERSVAFPGADNPLPQLLQTPSGVALLELQGTINMPESDLSPESLETSTISKDELSIGRLVFPDYNPASSDDKSWMKRVYLYVGKHQRLTGEVKKLPNPMAVIRKRQQDFLPEPPPSSESRAVEGEELEIMEIVEWKIIFSQRPEPVGS